MTTPSRILRLPLSFAIVLLAFFFGGRTQALTVTATTSDNGSPAHLVAWTDASGNPRSAMMVDQTTTETGDNSSYTGYMRQYTYVASGVTRVCTGRTGDGGLETSGDGFVQNHGENGADDSTGNGNGFSGTTTISPNTGTFSHVTITYSIPNYTVQGLGGGSKTVPTTVQWFFADGRNDPIFSITQDATATSGNLALDSRSPYGDMAYDGDASGDQLVGGDAWGDTYLFKTSDQANPTYPNTLTPQSAWNDKTANTIPFCMSWAEPDTCDAEMGHVATVPITVLDQGQDNEDGTAGDDSRNKSSSSGLPPASAWAYQVNSYSFGGAVVKNDTYTYNTDDKHITWGGNWGRLGGYDNSGGLASQYSEHSDDPIGDYLMGTRADSLLMSYSVFVVLGLHNTTSNVYNTSGAVGTVVSQMVNVTAAALTASTGSVVTSGPEGVGGSALTTDITYSPSGYNPVYSTWEISASGNAVNATLTPASGKSLANPVFLIDNYTLGVLPASISINGQSVSGTNYYATLDTTNQRLWITALGTATANSPMNLVVTVTPSISLSGNMAFGNVTVNSTSTSMLTINNPGNATLSVTSITYPSGFSGSFSGTIPAGGSQNVTVTFAPTSAITYGGTITVNSNASGGTNTITASGTGVNTAVADISLSGNMAFGNVIVNATSASALTISNPGTATLTVSSISYPDGFSGDWSSGTISAGGSQNVNVTFAPTSAITYGGTITVNSNAAGGTDTITASGAGVSASTDPFGGSSLGGGWNYSSWFGYYNTTFYPWIYRTDIGFCYVDTIDNINLYLYVVNGNPAPLGWLYTSEADFPEVYSFTKGSWLYFSVGSTSFYNWSTQTWEYY